ncbi:MAG: tryptophan-rich sensory protein [Clostridia bacterium]
MKALKWLYALVFALAFTLLIEWVGAVSVQNGLAWYTTLTLPAFSIKPIMHSIIWCVVYALSIYIIARLVIKNELLPYIYLYGLGGLLLSIWTVVFFVAHLKIIALIILLLEIIISFIYEKRLIKKHTLLAFLYLPILCWYSYLFIINYSIVLLN